jgi:hypothetical protein
MKPRRLLLILGSALVMLVVLVGVGALTQARALAYGDLVAQLRAVGATVADGGAIPRATTGPEPSTTLLSGAGHLLTVNGERVEVYEYATTVFAAADAARISPDGSTFSGGIGPLGGSAAAVDWVSIPHFYRSGRLIVQYIGTHSDVTTVLTQVLGPQIAGGPPEACATCAAPSPLAPSRGMVTPGVHDSHRATLHPSRVLVVSASQMGSDRLIACVHLATVPATSKLPARLHGAA